MPDVIVVGAGPAGSLCALQLARSGADVMIIDKADFPRRKVCGEYLNTAAVRELREHDVLKPIQQRATRLAGIRLQTTTGVRVELPFCEPALSISRSTLDYVLLQAAKDAGARFVRGRVEDASWKDDVVAGVIVRDPAGHLHSLRAQVVVAADGTGSLLAKKAGLTVSTRAKHRFALGGHYAGFGTLDNFIEMYVGKSGYFAINPLNETVANVMVVVDQSCLASWSAAVDEGMNGVVRDLAGGSRSLEAVVRVGNRVTTGPLLHRTGACARPGMLLVGDAAGFVDPFTGQGIALALHGASQAAIAIRGTLHRPADWKAYAAAYEIARAREF
ncbi:MAG: NAD(P)/FAD-dependent oxidoreductase, partial [Candidatus Eremiobacteraeota bacterium]|nr:NAD(P)/FAD-dependent oxidoreductase [Candidatus Eremiobacteraeota bacterium]